MINRCLSWNRALFEAGCEEYPWLVGHQHLCKGAGKWVWSVGSVQKDPQILRFSFCTTDVK